MKGRFTLACCVFASAAMAQPAPLVQAVITTKTTTIVPEGAESGGPQAMIRTEGGAEGAQVMRFGGDGETVSKTYLKNKKIKTVVENEMGRTTTIRDNTAGMTTTLMEMMGNKTGFYASDEDQAEIKKRMDSMIQTRGGAGRGNLTAELAYADESKTIAGYTCKKAWLLVRRPNGTTDSSAVWYSPDLQFDGLKYTGGPAASMFGLPNVRNVAIDALEQIKGFPMAYELRGIRGRRTIVEVSKIDIKKEVTDKEFEIPKDFTLKSAKEMQGANGGMQIRMGGPAVIQQ